VFALVVGVAAPAVIERPAGLPAMPTVAEIAPPPRLTMTSRLPSPLAE
jgi:hypothetical protein